MLKLVRIFFFSVLLGVVLFASVSGCSDDNLIWQIRDKNADPYYRFVSRGMVGYIDGKGRIVVPPSRTVFLGGNYGSEFHDGLLLTGIADGPYIDTRGKIALDTGLDRNWDFSDGLAAAMRSGENKWGYIDREGKFVIEPKFESYPKGYVYPFSNQMAMIKVADRFGFISTTGDFVISPSFLWAKRFSEDRARVIVDGPCVRPGFEYPCDSGEALGKPAAGENLPLCKVGFINKAGSLIGENNFEDARDFSEGLAAVQRDGKWGFIDKNGKLVVPFKFGSVGSFSDGLAQVSEGGLWQDKKWGYIDPTGTMVIPYRFERADNFSNGLAPVADKAYADIHKERFYYINKRGKRAFDGVFAIASPYFKGLAHVKHVSELKKDDYYLSGKYSYVDTMDVSFLAMNGDRPTNKR